MLTGAADVSVASGKWPWEEDLPEEVSLRHQFSKEKRAEGAACAKVG